MKCQAWAFVQSEPRPHFCYLFVFGTAVVKDDTPSQNYSVSWKHGRTINNSSTLRIQYQLWGHYNRKSMSQPRVLDSKQVWTSTSMRDPLESIYTRERASVLLCLVWTALQQTIERTERHLNSCSIRNTSSFGTCSVSYIMNQGRSVWSMQDLLVYIKRLQQSTCSISDALCFSLSHSLSLSFHSYSPVLFKAAVLAAVQSELGVFQHLAG